MDFNRRVAAGAVKKNLGPDPSMGRKVELLRRLVSMRKESGPRAGINPPPRNVRGRPVRKPRGDWRLTTEEGGGFRRVPTFDPNAGQRVPGRWKM